MNARIALCWFLAGFAIFAPVKGFAQQAITVYVNGQAMSFDQPPILQAGRVFVPLRGIFEQLGASVVYANGQINATGAGRTVSLTIGSTQATVNGQAVTIDVAPFVVGSRTLVPLRFIAQSLGASVDWNEATSSVSISNGSGQNYSGYIDTPPPPLPVYQQPVAPAPNYIWTPGYWAWGPGGYYWVPGAWVQAPQSGLYWTPGYWAVNPNGVGFVWNSGYWAPQVGFYGNISYGFGYFGSGYQGGRWGSNGFAYNTAYSNVNTTVIHNTYVSKTVVNTTVINRVSYVGGQGGIHAQPTAQQLAVAKMKHVPMTTEQTKHVQAAAQDRDLYVKTNQGKPPLPAVAKPLAVPPAGAKPPTVEDKRAAQVHVHPAAVAKPAPAVKQLPAVKPRPPEKPAAKPRPSEKPAVKPRPSARPTPF
jgi:Copper amine oxidase N-terminal domain/WXXGXW repeat (2 copies)